MCKYSYEVSISLESSIPLPICVLTTLPRSFCQCRSCRFRVASRFSGKRTHHERVQRGGTQEAVSVWNFHAHMSTVVSSLPHNTRQMCVPSTVFWQTSISVFGMGKSEKRNGHRRRSQRVKKKLYSSKEEMPSVHQTSIPYSDSRKHAHRSESLGCRYVRG